MCRYPRHRRCVSHRFPSFLHRTMTCQVLWDARQVRGRGPWEGTLGMVRYWSTVGEGGMNDSRHSRRIDGGELRADPVLTPYAVPTSDLCRRLARSSELSWTSVGLAVYCTDSRAMFRARRAHEAIGIPSPHRVPATLRAPRLPEEQAHSCRPLKAVSCTQEAVARHDARNGVRHRRHQSSADRVSVRPPLAAVPLLPRANGFVFDGRGQGMFILTPRSASFPSPRPWTLFIRHCVSRAYRYHPPSCAHLSLTLPRSLISDSACDDGGTVG